MKIIKRTAKSFFKHAICHYAKKDRTYDDEIQCICSLQGTLELILKYFFIEQKGLESLFIKNSEKTRNFGDLLKEAKKDNLLNIQQKDFDLIKGFQDCRNQICHFGLPEIPHDLMNKIIELIINVFSELEYKETLYSQNEEMTNLLKEILGTDLYEKFVYQTDFKESSITRINQQNKATSICLECE